jgi:hypothetical protein
MSKDKDFEEIYDRVRLWALDRRFNYIDYSYDSLMANIADETAEYYTAFAKYLRTKEQKYVEEMIDAKIDESIYIIADSVKQSSLVNKKYCKDTVDIVFGFIDSWGYDPVGCYDEVIKEITSRKGEWSKELNKWQKYKDQKTYKADFSKHKVGN